MHFRTISLILIFFSFYVSANAERGIIQVDLQQNYEPLLKTKSFNFYDAELPALELPYTDIVELEDYVVFFTYGDGIGYEPHILSKETKQVKPLANIDGFNKPFRFFVNYHKSFPLTQNRLLFGYGSSRDDWYIGDASAGTVTKWNPPLTSFDHVEAINQNEWLIASTPELFHFNNATKKLTKITDNIGRFNRVLHKEENILFVTDSFKEKTVLVINSESLESSLFEYDAHLYPNLLSSRMKKIDSSAFYFLKTIDEIQYLSGIDNDGSLVNYFSMSDIPACSDEDKRIVSAQDGVFDDGRYIYFRSIHEDGYFNGNCMVRFDSLTNEFTSISRQQIGGGSSWSIVGVGAGKMVVDVDKSSAFFETYHNLLELDFDNPSETFLIEPIPEPSSMEIISATSTSAFGYLGYSCNEKCLDNKFFKVDFISGDVVVFGSRIGVSDKKSDVTPEIRASIVNGELLYVAAVPYPSLVMTDSELINTRLLAIPYIQNETASAGTVDILPYSNGWIAVTRGFPSVTYDVSFNGTRSQIDFIDKKISSENINVVQTSDKVYFISTELWEYDGNSSIASKIIETNLSNNNSPYSKVINVIDNVAYVKSNKGEILTIDLGQNHEKVVGNFNATDIVKCADKVIALAKNNIIQKENLDTFGNFHILVDGQFEEFSTPNTSTEGFNTLLNMDAIREEEIFFIDGSEVHALNCRTLEYSSIEHEFSLRSLNGAEIQYDPFNEVYYWSDNILMDERIFKFDFESNTKTLVYSDFDKIEFVFSENGTYASPITSAFLAPTFYKFQDGNLIDMFPKRDPMLEYNIVNLTSSISSGRFIIGEFLEAGEPFIYDTLLDNMHTFDIYRGPERGINSFKDVLINSGYLAFGSNAERFYGEVTIVDIECAVGENCKARTNRSPIIDESEIALYYEEGDNVFYPFRAIDEDFDPLVYSIFGGPEWLTINDKGLIQGVVPNDSSSSYTFSVKVSDGSVDIQSKLHTLFIDDGSPPNVVFPNPVNPKPSPTDEANNGGGGGAVGFYIALIVFLIHMTRKSVANKNI